MTDELQQQWWKEDADRVNRMCAAAKQHGSVVSVLPARNVNRDEHGRFAVGDSVDHARHGKGWNVSEVHGDDVYAIERGGVKKYTAGDQLSSRGKAVAGQQSTPVAASKAHVAHIVDAMKRADKDGSNLVHMADLREASGLPRADFDRALDSARRARAVTMTAGEQRGGLTQRDRDAAIVEDPGTGPRHLTHASLTEK